MLADVLIIVIDISKTRPAFKELIFQWEEICKINAILYGKKILKLCIRLNWHKEAICFSEFIWIL